MADRVLPKEADSEHPSYALAGSLSKFSSGCQLLDCALGGGWAEGRFLNLVGDKSTGKTLLAIEACANFARKYPKGLITYLEAEAAFDEDYAESLGFPVERVRFIRDARDVESWYEDMEKLMKEMEEGPPVLYVVDSLDALSDRAELARKIDDGTYAMGKSKKLSEIFRRMVGQWEDKNLTVLVVSQVRENIGVTFGEKYTRAGGKSLDFYASQVVWLANMGQIKKTRKSIERTVGVKVRAKLKKNKVGLPFREADFPIYFGFGVEDLVAGVDFLKQTKRLSDAGFGSDAAASGFLRNLNKLTDEEYFEAREKVARAVRTVWHEIEQEFKPSRKKYK